MYSIAARLLGLKAINPMQVMRQRAQELFRQLSPSYRMKTKHDAELAHWKSGLQNLEDWFLRGSDLRIGLRTPTADQKLRVSDSPIVNAVMTMHALRPHYTERLRIERSQFRGQRVLEIGCGPMAPILQFDDCERHCIDPLVDVYMASGWPLYDYDAKFINTGGESLPYRDAYFDAVISVNALDHVNDFEQTAREIQRVLKPQGRAFLEVEYHEPTVTEPLKLDDARVVHAFSRCQLTPVINRSGKDLYETLVKKFNLLPYDFPHFDARFVTWHGRQI
jgi:SAM-dependent methyltransferase